jgi:hypothetical protein
MDYYQAGIALNNQKIEKQNAGYALEQGEQQTGQVGQQVRAQVGQIRDAQSASGLDINKGTAPLVPGSQRLIGQEEQATVRGNAAKQAYDYDVSAFQYGEQAKLDEYAGTNAAQAGAISSEASILGSAASVSSKWLGFNQEGAFGNLGSSIAGGFRNAISGL